MKTIKVRLIIRAGKYETSRREMEKACERYTEESGYPLVSLEKRWKWGYEATFNAPDGEFSGMMIAIETGDPNWKEEVDILFGPGQMVGEAGDRVVENKEYYEDLGIGE